MTKKPLPLPRDERITHIAHSIVEHNYPLTDATWQRYGLRNIKSMQRRIAKAVLRLQAVLPPQEGA